MDKVCRERNAEPLSNRPGVSFETIVVHLPNAVAEIDFRLAVEHAEVPADIDQGRALEALSADFGVQEPCLVFQLECVGFARKAEQNIRDQIAWA